METIGICLVFTFCGEKVSCLLTHTLSAFSKVCELAFDKHIVINTMVLLHDGITLISKD